MSHALPPGWVACTLGDVVDILDAQRVPINNDERTERIKNKDVLYPYYGATGQVGWIDEYIFDENLILLGEDGAPFFEKNKNKSYLIQGKTWVNNHAHVLRSVPNLSEERYINYYLNQIDYTDHVTGSTRPKLTQSSMKQIPFKLAPLAEQKRIADKLDEVLERVEACRERLNQATIYITKLKSSLIQKFIFSNQNFSQYPFTEIKNIVDHFSYGTSSKSSPEGATPVLRMGNIQNGKIIWDDLVYTSDPEEEQKYKLSTGDLLFNRTNSPELVGKTALYEGERPAIYAGYLIKIKCGPQILPKFLNYCLNSLYARDYCWKVKTDGVSQSNINAKKLAAFPIPLPPLEEQTKIVHQLDKILSQIKQAELQNQEALSKLDKLAASTLARAFRGELVAQDPSDEPASALLERIEASRGDSVRRRGRGRAGVVREELGGLEAELGAAPTDEGFGGWQQMGLFGPGLPEGVSRLDAVLGGPRGASTASASEVTTHVGSARERVLGCLRGAGSALGKAAILEGAGLSEGEWLGVIRALVSEGAVVQEGQKRGARYRLG